jgi:hypothetical protein
MRTLSAVVVAATVLSGLPVLGGHQAPRLNPLIALHEAGRPVFGLYAPSARQGGRRGTPAVVKTPAELAADTLGVKTSDFFFNGAMENGLDRGLPDFVAYVEALRTAGATVRTHPLVVKTPEIAPDPAAAVQNIGRQLNTGKPALLKSLWLPTNKFHYRIQT